MQVSGFRLRKVVLGLMLALVASGGIVYMGAAGVALACTPTTVIGGITFDNFICPGGPTPYTGNSYDRPQTVDINVSSPQGNGDSFSPSQIDAGADIQIDLTYTPGITRSDVWAWIQTSASISNIDPAPISQNKNGNPGTALGTDYPVKGKPTQPGCPSFWVGPNSPYQNAANATASTGPDSPYNLNDWQLLATAKDGHTGCGDQPDTTGTSAIWKNAGGSAGRTYKYTAVFRVDPNANPDATMCFGGRVSAGGGATNNPIAVLKARDINNGGVCFKIGKAIIKGTVRSDPTRATGKPLANVNIRYNKDGNCSGPWSLTTTDVNGEYQFTAAQRRSFCIEAPNPLRHAGTGSPIVDGTSYSNPNPAQHFSPNGCSTDECNFYNFRYQPDPVPPNLVKLSPQNGSAVTPGSRIDYALYANNIYDSNSPTANISDPIPLNIDPVSVVIDDVSMSEIGTPFRPTSVYGSWTNETFTRPGKGPSSACIGLPSFYSYGYGAAGRKSDGSFFTPASFTCGYSFGSGGTPGFIGISFSVLPAYSQVLIRWHGNVKAASNIGVYPGDPSSPLIWGPFGASGYPGNGDYRYCGNSSGGINVGNYSNTSVLDECTDYVHGNQGVSNYGVSTIGGSGPAFSNITYSPIPGTVTCISKDYGPNMHYDLPTPPTPPGPGPCAVSTPAGNPIVSVKSPYNIPDFKINIGAQASNAPIRYDVMDQLCPAGGGACQPLSPNFSSPVETASPIGAGPSVAPQIGQPSFAPNLIDNASGPLWRDYLSLPGTQATYNFGVTVNASGGIQPGDKIRNHACVHLIRYDLSSYTGPLVDGLGYPRDMACTPDVVMTYVDIIAPYLTAEKNHVAAGGDPGGPDASGCTKTDFGVATGPFVRANSGSTGRYLITASGGVSGIVSVASALNSSYPGAPKAYCYEDLVKNIDRYLTKKPALPLSGISPLTVLTTIPPLLGGVDDGSVVRVNAPVGGCYDPAFGLPIGLTISKRFTLYVIGDLCIHKNITYDSTRLAASFGVIATGNIYIDKDVTNLDGYYYAAPGYGVGGIINTCAASGTKTLSNFKRDFDTGDTSNYSPSECKNSLTVRGLLLASTFRFNRTGKTTAPNAAAEYFESLAQLYLLTPPGFDDLSSTQITPIGQQQQLPRY